jgi:hypothetical protein
MLLVAVPPAFADPGAPGLDRPSTSVYGNSNPPPVIGKLPEQGRVNTPPVNEPNPTTGNGPPVGEPNPTSAPEPGVAGANTGGGDGVSVDSLPFTGFSAALVLAAGLMALLLGLMARVAAGRLRRA